MATQNRPETRTFFVVGCLRSGTTLVARFVASHDSIGYLEETTLVHTYLSKVSINKEYSKTISSLPWALRISLHLAFGKAKMYSDKKRLKVLVKNILAHSLLESIPDLKPSGRLIDSGLLEKVQQKHVDKLLNKYQEIKDPKALFRIMLDDFRVLTNKPKILEKTPSHYRYIPYIFDLFPEAKVLHVLRDGRATVASMLYLGWYKNWKKACKRWKEAVLLNEQYSKKYSNSKYTAVRYEDFTTNPEKIGDNILAFFGLRRTKKMTDLLKDVEKKSIEDKNSRWNTTISPKLQAKITKYLKPELDKFYYN
jgi:hypothetical protein